MLTEAQRANARNGKTYSLTLSLAFFSFTCVCECIFICRKQLYAWLNDEINLPASALHVVVYFVAFRKTTS